MIDESSATAAADEQHPGLVEHPDHPGRAERQRDQRRDDQRHRQALDAGHGATDPGAGQDVAGPEDAGQQGQREAAERHVAAAAQPEQRHTRSGEAAPTAGRGPGGSAPAPR